MRGDEPETVGVALYITKDETNPDTRLVTPHPGAVLHLERQCLPETVGVALYITKDETNPDTRQALPL
jgi:hypothetical protein